MFYNNSRKNWGNGIPTYNQEDLMSKEELYDFALEVVSEYETKNTGGRLLQITPNMNNIPSFSMEIDGETIFVLVEADVYPGVPTLSNSKKELLINQAKKFNVECYFAPVVFGSADPIRYNASIALRGDGFYANYKGLIKISETEK